MWSDSFISTLSLSYFTCLLYGIICVLYMCLTPTTILHCFLIEFWMKFIEVYTMWLNFIEPHWISLEFHWSAHFHVFSTYFIKFRWISLHLWISLNCMKHFIKFHLIALNAPFNKYNCFPYVRWFVSSNFLTDCSSNIDFLEPAKGGTTFGATNVKWHCCCLLFQPFGFVVFHMFIVGNHMFIVYFFSPLSPIPLLPILPPIPIWLRKQKRTMQ